MFLFETEQYWNSVSWFHCEPLIVRQNSNVLWGTMKKSNAFGTWLICAPLQLIWWNVLLMKNQILLNYDRDESTQKTCSPYDIETRLAWSFQNCQNHLLFFGESSFCDAVEMEPHWYALWNWSMYILSSFCYKQETHMQNVISNIISSSSSAMYCRWSLGQQHQSGLNKAAYIFRHIYWWN